MSTLYPDAFKDGSTAAHRMDPVADLIGGGRTIAYQVPLARLAGSATTGVWLSQIWFWTNFWQNSGRTDSNRWDGDWLAWTQEEVEEQTALSRREHDTARKTLREMGVIEESKRGLPMKIWFRLNKDRLYVLLRAHAAGLPPDPSTNLGGNRQDDENGDLPASDAPNNPGDNDQPILAIYANLESEDTPANLGGNCQDIKDIKIIDRSIEITTTDQPIVSVVANVINDDLIERVSTITGGIDAAQSILTAYGAEVVKRQLTLWPTRSKSPANPGGLFRSCCQNDWPDPAVARAAARAESDRRYTPRYVVAPDSRGEVSGGEHAARRVVVAPMPIRTANTASKPDVDQARLDSVVATLSSRAIERLEAEVDVRIRAEKPWLASRLANYRAGERVSGPTVPDTITATRYAILAEREAAPIIVCGREYYDIEDANAARVEADFG